MAEQTEQRFSTRLGLLLSVLGIAVGTGNIWRFPRIAAQNGGEDGAGAFLVAWLIFLFVWSVPLIIAEYALGRKGRMGLVGTFGKIAGKKFAWMGAFVGFVATAIMFYYSVVAGWCVFYLGEMLTNPLPLTHEAAQGVWDGFQSGGWPVLFHAGAMGFGALAVWKGVSSIERVNKVLIPALLLIVLISVVRAVTLPGAGAGLKFLFTPQWDLLGNPEVWLAALTQNAWDTGAGWGLILTYGAYMQYKHGVVKNAFITGVGNNLVSILAAIMIFGTVFALLDDQVLMPTGETLTRLEVMQQSGPASTGLTFIWMPQLFARMGDFGVVMAVIFFLGLSFAAYSSLISMIELTTRVFIDFGLSRPKAIASVCTIGFVLGIPSAINLNILGNQDFVWGVALMISGAFVAFAVIRYGVQRFRRDCVDGAPGDWSAGRVWEVLMRYVVPFLAVVLLVWWLYQAATVYAPDTWYDPIDPYSVMTCLVQWGTALLLLIGLNRWMVKHTLGVNSS
ncbi:MAG: sodium-dependent transporter [Rhodothermales bacterium]